MKFRHSIRFRIAFFILIAGMISAAIYSLLLYVKLEQNRAERILRQIEFEGNRYMDYYAEKGNLPLQYVSFVETYIGKDSMPDKYKGLVKGLSEGIHRIIRDAEYYVFVKHLPKNEETFYLIWRYDFKSFLEIANRHAIPALLGVLIIVAILAAISAFAFSNLMISPLIRLTDKLKVVNPENFPENFSKDYSDNELGFIAKKIESLLQDLKNHIDREHQFTRAVSHELRTPVAIIKGSTELIKEIMKGDSKKYSPHLLRIHRSLTQMESIIEALIWLYKEAKLDLPREKCYPIYITEEIIQNYKSIYQDKGLEVDFIARDNPVIIAPPPLFRVVIDNLIRNAFQHTYNGKIKIEVNQHCLEVVNPWKYNGQTNDIAPQSNNYQMNPCFGVGLDLVTRLCESFGWQFTIKNLDREMIIATFNFHAGINGVMNGNGVNE